MSTILANAILRGVMPNKPFVTKATYAVYALLLVSASLLLYIWNTTNPATISPAGILAVFVLLYFFWLSIFFIAIHICYVLLGNTIVFRLFAPRKKSRNLRQNTVYYVASVLAFVPVLILAIQSVNQLTVRDILLVFLFVLLAVFYVVKRL